MSRKEKRKRRKLEKLDIQESQLIFSKRIRNKDKILNKIIKKRKKLSNQIMAQEERQCK